GLLLPGPVCPTVVNPVFLLFARTLRPSQKNVQDLRPLPVHDGHAGLVEVTNSPGAVGVTTAGRGLWKKSPRVRGGGENNHVSLGGFRERSLENGDGEGGRDQESLELWAVNPDHSKGSVHIGD
ncbi:hypothetical protein H1C71_040131, partial [Ictidomys tridecemlineatus]